MLVAGKFPATIGYRERAFECSTCGRLETLAVPVDPLGTDVVGWLAGELKPPR